jgi:methionyl-tRNA formyltransferase
MKLIFMGTPDFAVPSLKKLIEAGHEVFAVFTQPDRPVGRKQVVTPPPVKVFAAERGITVYQPTKIKTAEARAAIEPLFQQADAGIVAAYGRILPDWMLAAPRLGASTCILRCCRNIAEPHQSTGRLFTAKPKPA